MASSTPSRSREDWRPPEELDPASLEEMRRLGRTDLFIFAKLICGFGDLVRPLHSDMAAHMMSPSLRKLNLIPRGHFKTSLNTIAYACWRVINNPNIRILLSSASAAKSVSFLSMISLILGGRKSDYFNLLYPEVIPSKEWLKYNSWNATEITVPRSQHFAAGTVEAIGVGAGAAGRHHDIHIKDDLVDERIASSDLEMESVKEWHKTSDALFDVPELGVDIINGTRWGADDYYGYILDDDLRYDLFFRSCYDENGEPVFPERFSKSSLEELRRVMGERHFGLQYLNNPKFSSIGVLDTGDLRYYELEADDYVRRENDQRKIDLRQCNVYMMVDPARVKHKRGCKSAVIVAAVDHEGNIYILEAWKDRVDPNQLIEKLYSCKERWKVKKCAIEGVGYQEALITMVDNVTRHEKRRFCPVEAIYPKHAGDQHGKDARIEGMGQYARTGRLYVRRDQKDFITEWGNFGTKKDMDLLDAFHYGPRIWELPINPQERADQLMRGFSLYGRRPSERRPHSGGYR